MRCRFLLLFLLVLLGACAVRRGVDVAPITHPAALPYASHTGIVYTPDGWPETLKGDLYYPDAGPKVARPAVLLIHGGAWLGGYRFEMLHIAQALAQRGYVAFSIDYRLAPEHPYPAALDDVRVALKWLNAHADEYGIDRNRLALWGYSSGAQLAGMIAAALPPDTPPIAVAVLGATPADLVKLGGHGPERLFIGEPIDEAKRLYVQASPLARINEHSVPMFLYHGTWDWLISDDNSENMYVGLRALGVPAELYLQRGTGHFTTFLLDRGPLHAALDFLDDQLGMTAGAPQRASSP